MSDYYGVDNDNGIQHSEKSFKRNATKPLTELFKKQKDKSNGKHSGNNKKHK